MEIEIDEVVEVTLQKRVSIGSAEIACALADAHQRAMQEAADDRTLCRTITAAIQVLEAISTERLRKMLKPAHQTLLAEKLRDQAARFDGH